ncbi:hypothetical protein D9V37_09425 [Nocardioides mangrovicus]|uniref:Uncharacterized protein n=1 Tax=Nocardioides mangrovicus TaxID=2478913 RepID=A0A3L8P5X3_9ACTN|nr:hypothetical protein [Nocardioides mangrovicus]RLV50069.1 hypothetical protein D9V37_09425 [Nocardioides mangrovicus]
MSDDEPEVTEHLSEDLSGGMGTSSERVGKVRGSQEPATSGEVPTFTDDAPSPDAAPEQSAAHTHLDENPPDPPNKRHDSRLHGYPSAPDERGEGRKGT